MLSGHKNTQHIIRIFTTLVFRWKTTCHLNPYCDAPPSGRRRCWPADNRRGGRARGYSAQGRMDEGVACTPAERPRGLPTQKQQRRTKAPSLPLWIGCQRPEPRPHPQPHSRFRDAQTTAWAARLSSPDSPSSPFLLRPRQAQPPAPPPPSSPAVSSQPRTCSAP